MQYPDVLHIAPLTLITLNLKNSTPFKKIEKKKLTNISLSNTHTTHTHTHIHKHTDDFFSCKSLRILGVEEVLSEEIYTYISSYGRRQWQPSPVLLPGKSHGRRSQVGCRLQGRTESEMTDAT